MRHCRCLPLLFLPANDKSLDSAERFVWVYQSATQQVERRAVTTGRLTSEGIEILSGVANRRTSGDRWYPAAATRAKSAAMAA